jgi:parallel beta-helix repeat protein
LALNADDSIVRGFVINRFSRSAIAFINANNNTIAGNYLGTDITGKIALGNQWSGISGYGSGNTIGGTNESDRNLISGNRDGGVYVSMSDTRVLNNYIGTDITGMQDLGNSFGVRFHHGSHNILRNNTISGNDGHGAWIDGNGSENNIVQGNFIGTSADGMSAIANNGFGLTINGDNTNNGTHNNIVGGTTPETRNLISGNLQSGININFSSGNIVQGNYIGTNITGTQSLGNGIFGIRLNGNGSAIGGTEAGAGNLISGNTWDGIYATSSENDITGNIIGADVSGLNPLPNGNDGVQVGQDNGPANDNTLSDNTIAFNQGSGIYLSQGTENTFSENNIYDNNWEGIDFKPGYNTNESQPAPTLTSAILDGDTAMVQGTLNHAPNTIYRVEFFSNPDNDGEGKIFLGSQTVTTNSNGNTSFNVNLSGVETGQFITATVSDPDGNTSEFSTGLEIDSGALSIPIKTGEEFLINTETNNNQTDPAIAALNDGGFVVVWESKGQDGSGDGIYAQRYDRDNNPIHSEFPVNTHTHVDQGDPAITALNDGGFVIVWASEGQDGSGNGIYAQRYDRDNNPIHSEFPVNTHTLDGQWSPAITNLADGGFLVTWHSDNQDNSSSGIYAQRYDSNSNPIGTEFQVNTHTNEAQWDSSVTVLTDGSFVISWTSNDRDGNSGSISAQRYDREGNGIVEEFQVNVETIDNQWDSSLTALQDGGFLVTWQSTHQDGSGLGVYGRRFDRDGNAISREFQINTYTNGNQSDSAVTPLIDGGFIVSWSSWNQDGSWLGIFGQRFDRDSNTIGDEFQINTYSEMNQSDPAIITLDGGEIIVTWESGNNQDGNGSGIYGQRFTVE